MEAVDDQGIAPPPLGGGVRTDGNFLGMAGKRLLRGGLKGHRSFKTTGAVTNSKKGS